MKTTIDQKIVEMRFDNKNFENKVRETMSTLEKFKQKLNLTGASKGLEDINSTANKVNFGGMFNAINSITSKFGTLEVIGITALTNITNAAVNAGKRIVSALTIDPIKTGFSEYETQINAVQTILANTESKGTTLQEVNRALDELNLYADKTIYNFTEMTRNIGTFTAAGIDLKTSVSAIQGIANLAAVSGSTSQQASTAMYQLSQALASGTVKLMDWNSVVNAGMGGQVFQDALKATAKVHGKNVDKIIKKNGSFRESLQEGWITSEILTETLNKFTMAAEEGSEQWESYKKSLTKQGYSAKEAENILKMANTATEAATKVKTFTQLFDTLKESAQSGWTSTWEIIVGDFGEAKEFLTTISDTVGGMLSASADARNKLLTGGLSTGWKQLLSSGIADEEGYKETIQKVAKKNGFEFDKLIKETEQNGGTYEDALKKALTDGNITSDMLTESVSELSKKMQGMSLQQLEAAGYTKDHVQQIKELDEGLKNGTISMEEFTKRMMRSSGRENLIESLSNAFKGLMNIINPIKQAFHEVFPAMESEELYNITVKIKEMTASFALFTEKYAPQIKSTFKGIFSVLNVGVTFVKEVANGILRLLGNFKGLTGGVLTATGSFGDFLTNISESITKAGIFGKVIDTMVNFLQKGIDKVKELTDHGMFKSFLDVLTKIFSLITAVGSKIGKVVSESIRSGDLMGVMSVFNTGVIGSILLGINKFVSNLSGSFKNITEALDSVKGILESYQQDLKAKTLIKIATAVGILAASLFLLSMIKPENLAAGLTAITVLFADLIGVMAIFTKIMPDIKNITRTAVGLLSLASAMLILSVAMKILSTMSWDEMWRGLISTAAGLGALIGAVWALPEKEIHKTSKAIKKLSTSLVIFSLAMKILGTMSWDEMWRGLISIVGGLGALIGFVWAIPKDMGTRTAGIMGLTTSLVILAGALKIMSTLSWDDMLRGLAATAASLAILIGFIWAIPKTTSKRTAGLIGLATSLVILAGALKVMATMNVDEIHRSIAVMGASLGILAATIILISKLGGNSVKIITIAGSLFIIAGALVVLASALKILGSMSIESIHRSMATLVATLVIIGVAGAALSSIIPAILGLAASVALFGIGALALGVGLGLIAAGITALAVALSAGTTAIVAGLSAIILGIAKLVPDLIGILGDAIKVLCNVIIECAPLIADTVLVVISKILESLAKYTPSIVSSLMEFLIGVLQELRDHLPDLIVAAVEVIGAFFQGIVNALKGINPSSLLQGVLGLTLLTAMIYMLSGIAALIPGAMIGVLGLGLIIGELALVLAAIGAFAQIPGLSWLIEQGGNFLQKIGTAIGQFIGGLIGGVALGATSTLPQVGTNLSEFMTNLLPFINGVKMVDANTLGNVAMLAGAITLLSGANLISGIASFLSFGSSLAELGTDLSNFMINSTGFIVGASLINPSMLDGVRALADTILILTAANVLDGLTSWFTGGSSLAEFGSQLGDLGTNMNQFATNLGTFTEAQMNTINRACQAIKSLALAANEIPNEGGFWASIVGENSLATFGSYLPALGGHLSGFITSLGTFTEAQVSTVNCASQAIKALATSAKEIPNEGGLWAAIVGENSLATFGKNLPALGEHLSAFIINLGTFDESKVSMIDCAGRAIKALAVAASEIPNEGGLWAKLAGDNSIATFGSHLPGLGTNLSSFVTNLGTFDESKIATVDCAGKAIKALASAANSIPNEGGLWAKIAGDNSLATFGAKLPGIATNIKDFVANLGTFSPEQVSTVYSACAAIRAIAQLGTIDIKDTGKGLNSFGKNMVNFAKKVKSFVDHIGEVGSDSITSSIEKTKDLINMARSMADINIESIKTFGDSLKKVAKDGVKGFVKEFDGKEPKAEAEKAVGEMVDAGIKGAENKKTDVKDKFGEISEAAVDAMSTKELKEGASQAGKDLVTGFANGIKNNKYLATDAGSSIGKAALKAAKEAIDSNSPSKEAHKLGNFFGEGFVIGIKDYAVKTYNASYSVAEQAKKGLSLAISKVSDLMSNGMDGQPTIRPVLDLSEVESGVGALGSMFSNGPSIGVTSNLRAISSAMNSKIQNGQNNDVISAINKLGKNLGNVKGGDTYNFDGITYSGDSEINNAVQTLVRAVKMERRV